MTVDRRPASPGRTPTNRSGSATQPPQGPRGHRPIRLLHRPSRPSIKAFDLAFAGTTIVVVTTLMWLRHGGAARWHGAGGPLTSIGELAALYGTLLILGQIVLMCRAPWIERTLGHDRLVHWHRWVGFAAMWALLGHVVFTTVGYAQSEHAGLAHEAWALLDTYPDVLAATVGFGLLIAVVVTSVRKARRALSYETWYFVHLYSYLALALAFAHQFAVGVDFTDDKAARAWWILLYAVAAFAMIGWRVSRPLILLARHRFVVSEVRRETDGVVSIMVAGQNGHETLTAEAGQFFMLRFLTIHHWWQAHPFSLSAAPNTKHLRFTVKALGDGSNELQDIKPGTKVLLEGPYGRLTAGRRTRSKVLLIGAGVGITPMRALFEQLPADPGDLTLLYRARKQEEVLFRGELDHLAETRKHKVHYLVGRRPTKASDDPFQPSNLVRLVRDLPQHDVFLCGPVPFMDAVTKNLIAAGVPLEQIHSERFDY